MYHTTGLSIKTQTVTKYNANVQIIIPRVTFCSPARLYAPIQFISKLYSCFAVAYARAEYPQNGESFVKIDFKSVLASEMTSHGELLRFAIISLYFRVNVF